MLYLVGGAARAGKTVVAHQLLSERRIPYFSLDYLVSGLSRGAPSLGVTHESGSIVRGEKLWPIVGPLLRNIAEVEFHYLIEGESLLPAHVSELQNEYPDHVRACFLGYAKSDVTTKVAKVRQFPSPVNDWVTGLSDRSLRKVISSHRDFSEYLEVECKRLGLVYLETSERFEEAVEGAAQELSKGL